MCHLRHTLRIFLFRRKVMFLLRYLSFCIFNHPMIYQICVVMVSISTRDRVHFRIYLLNHNSLSYQTWLTDRYAMTRILRNLLNNLEDWGKVLSPFQFSNLLQLLINQLCQHSSVSLF